MLYAKIVLGLPIEGPFDYSVPADFTKNLKPGMRVWVNFRFKRKLGYVAALAKKTDIKNIKPVLEVIDEAPVLDKNMLTLTKKASDYYCCSWGEAIETALPQGLRRGKKIKAGSIPDTSLSERTFPDALRLIHDLDGIKRWDRYIREIKIVLEDKKSVIILLPDKNSIIKTKELIEKNFNIPISVLYRDMPQEAEEWLKIKSGSVDIVIGTRASIFAPLGNLGLIIVDEEQNNIYKQDQSPHYNAREVAFMRADIEKARLILGSASPSLETIYLAKKNKIRYERIARSKIYPEIKIINMSGQHRDFKQSPPVFSKYIEDSVGANLNSKGKTLLFLNRKGFATYASCRNCNTALRCPRCNINLVLYAKENILNCRYCNFKMQPPHSCPNCNSSYIRYSGAGTEKIESELSRLFPQAKIRLSDGLLPLDITGIDILVSTKSIIKESDYYFDLIVILSVDNSLNRIDFRSAEKTFEILSGLLRLTEKRILIQTHLPKHHCFKALSANNVDLFYDEELKQRKQLIFPPFEHIGIVKLRSVNEYKVRDASQKLFGILNKQNKKKSIKILSVAPGQPAKLRGKFYWQVLVKAGTAKQISGFLKKQLKNFSHSGIIVTVDIDPV